MRGFIIALILALLSLSAGWLRAGLSASDMPADNDQWGELVGANIEPSLYTKVAEGLRKSDIFPISLAEEKRLAEIEPTVTTNAIEGVPEFPVIGAYSVLDGVPHVHLILKDKTIVKAKAGDQLESGWQLKSVDSRRVSAVYGDREQDFWVSLSDKDLAEKKD